MKDKRCAAVLCFDCDVYSFSTGWCIVPPKYILGTYIPRYLRYPSIIPVAPTNSCDVLRDVIYTQVPRSRSKYESTPIEFSTVHIPNIFKEYSRIKYVDIIPQCHASPLRIFPRLIARPIRSAVRHIFFVARYRIPSYKYPLAKSITELTHSYSNPGYIYVPRGGGTIEKEKPRP